MTLVNFESSNADLQIVVTFLGISISVIPLLLNILLLISVRPLDSITRFKLLQCPKAPQPISFTLFGITTSTKPVLENALSPITSKLLGK